MPLLASAHLQTPACVQPGDWACSTSSMDVPEGKCLGHGALGSHIILEWLGLEGTLKII